MELIDERYALAMDRIKEAASEEAFGQPLQPFFGVCTDLLILLAAILERALSGGISSVSKEELAAENHRLYADILPENYGKSFADPDYIVPLFEKAGIPDAEEMAHLLSFLYTELRGLIGYAYEGRKEIFTIFAELFIQIHTMFTLAADEDCLPSAESVRSAIYWFESDCCDIITPCRIGDTVDPSNDFLRRIVCSEDLDDDRYLYLSGEYVTDDEIRCAHFLRSLPDEEIQLMADTFTEGYRIGFVKAGKPIDEKKSANIRYCLGFERVVRAAVANFEKMGLQSVIYRAGSLSLTKSSKGRIGFYGAIPNRQYDYDHKDDEALYFDAPFVTRKLEVLEGAYLERRSFANTHAGPAVMEVFGEEPFSPKAKETAVRHSERTQKLSVDYSAKASEIVNRYIIGEERSFTIIAFPTPAIGADYEDIFADTVKLNTLPYKKYEDIQQHIIDALDTADYVEIKGKGENVTDIRVALRPLFDPAAETKFENCVSDVNIPVGEVFTSPVLSGTEGVLNVTRVYLNGLLYEDLKLTFAEGMISDYSCSNYDDMDKGRKYIKDNVLFGHVSLPIGEFAIGTNTTAYRMGRDYGIERLLPILIAEKTGPHFAVGDTCYSHEEDVKVYNPDSKEIIAKENEVSAKRKTDAGSAYFQCHTDITIPYDELAYIRAVPKGGEPIYIIKDGMFALSGTEELNGPLIDMKNLQEPH
ncbi:MAG: aminopeptidase [Lachnospiraceae bacterium]|nr:aminopeptidase [Lachnospiraceae bacterium]